MISYLKGKVIKKEKDFLIVLSGAVGFKVYSEQALLSRAKEGEEIELWTFLDVGERALKLFGFLSAESLNLFSLLRSVSGVGPKAALDTLSAGSPEEIKKEILTGNEEIFDKIPGIGSKRAKKIIFELSGIIKKQEESPEEQNPEVYNALKNLGFSAKDIQKVMKEIPAGTTPEDAVRIALKSIHR